MYEIDFGNGCTALVGAKVYKQYQADLREADLREALDQSLAAAEQAGDWEHYSDLFKDLYGVRPR